MLSESSARSTPNPARAGASAHLSFRSCLRDTAFPRSKWCYVFHLVAVLAGLDYWIGTFRWEPQLPLSLAALYRPEGDTEYVALAAALARGVIGEFSFADSFGEGVQAFPFVPLVIHAACVALLGDVGFVFADGIVALLYYLSFTLFLRAASLSDGVSRLTSVVAVSGLWNWLSINAQDWASLQPPYLLLLWGRRFARPFVTEPIWLLCLAFLVAVVTFDDARRSRGHWIALGALFAGVFQSDVYSAAIIGPSLAIVALLVVFTSCNRTVLLNTAMCVLAFAITASPFVWQRLRLHPDVLGRLGLFSLPRWPPVQLLWEWRDRLFQVIVVLGLAGTFTLLRRSDAGRQHTLRILAVLALITMSAWWAMPLSTILTGRGLQVYHFESQWWAVTSYVLLTGVLLLSRSLGRTLRGYLSSPGQAHIAGRRAGGVALAGTFSTLCVYWGASSSNRIWEGDPRFGQFYGASYKRDLVALVAELTKPQYDGQVLGTLDHTLYAWWVSFRHGVSFLADPFLSTRSNRELEARFMQFCHALGVPNETFAALAADRLIQIFWVSHAKYNASRLHAFSSPSDYPEAVQRELERGSLLNAWNIVLPFSEVARMHRAYVDRVWTTYDFVRPQLIVLTSVDRMRLMTPEEAGFFLVYTNPTFQIWRTSSAERLPP